MVKKKHFIASKLSCTKYECDAIADVSLTSSPADVIVRVIDDQVMSLGFTAWSEFTAQRLEKLKSSIQIISPENERHSRCFVDK